MPVPSPQTLSPPFFLLLWVFLTASLCYKLSCRAWFGGRLVTFSRPGVGRRPAPLHDINIVVFFLSRECLVLFSLLNNEASYSQRWW